jgi:hypothetical protein
MHPLEGVNTTGFGKPAMGRAGMRRDDSDHGARVLVAIEPVDGRKGIDFLSQLCFCPATQMRS